MENKNFSLYQFLTQLKENNKLVKGFNIESKAFTSLTIYTYDFDDNGELEQYSYSDTNFKLKKEIVEIVALGQHQGFDENENPIIKKIVLKSELELALEVKKYLIALEASKHIIVEKRNAIKKKHKEIESIRASQKKAIEDYTKSLGITTEDLESEFLKLEYTKDEVKDEETEDTTHK